MLSGPCLVTARRIAGVAALYLTLLAISGCAHHRSDANLPPAETPPPATYPPGSVANIPSEPRPIPLARIPITPLPPGGITAEDVEFVATHRPIYTQRGFATWYTAPYRGRKSANGQVFDDNALVAAHRTLPMGSLITVTNLRTGQRGTMRVADRGPFVEGRIVDLTIASAKVTGVYGAGLVPVRLDVYETPKPVMQGGRWCVQIGAFTSERKAIRLKVLLQREYPDANVIEFPGEDSFWVRIRPEGDNREQATYIAHNLHPSQGKAFLTRLD